MNRFERTLETAKRNYNSYATANNSHISNLAFGSAGHMSRGARNRLNSMSDVRHQHALKVETREIMLMCFNCTPFERKIFKIDGEPYTDITNVDWEGLSAILEAMSMRKHWNDETEYYQLSFNSQGTLGSKLNAICYFINRYGNANDKKILLPKFTL